MRSRRVGGSTYQIPVEVHAHRRRSWQCGGLLNQLLSVQENMVERLAAEL